MSTRYCVLTATDSSVNAKPPVAPVTTLLPTARKPCVYGHGFAWSCTWRALLPVPLRTPASVVDLPMRIGFGRRRE